MAYRTVLVVDGDEPMQELLTAALRDEGYLVLLSHNGASLEVAHNEQPGVILLDPTMLGAWGGSESALKRRYSHCTYPGDCPVNRLPGVDCTRASGR